MSVVLHRNIGCVEVFPREKVVNTLKISPSGV